MKSKKQSYDRVAKFFDFLRQGDMRRWNTHQKIAFRKSVRKSSIYWDRNRTGNFKLSR